MGLNAWSLRKDPLIKRLLVTLVARFGEDSFRLSKSWQDDLHAVGLCHREQPELLAYVYTYSQKPESFGVHLEYPDGQGSMVMHENTSQSQLLELLAAHLELTSLNQAASDGSQF